MRVETGVFREHRPPSPQATAKQRDDDRTLVADREGEQEDLDMASAPAPPALQIEDRKCDAREKSTDIFPGGSYERHQPVEGFHAHRSAIIGGQAGRPRRRM
jgi:hypothetical protein